ncbi:MAG: ponA [Pseudonocardiales bacterium]|nr:ponA [Pseudonocardiales bacterium]
MARSGRPNPLITLVKLSGAIALCGVIAAGFLIPYIGGLGLAARAGADKFLDTKCDLVEAPVEQKTAIYAADGATKITEVFDDNRTVIGLDQIPVIARQALVDTEDRRFYDHHGVDLRGLIRAAASNSDETTQGASTLTQQYVKQVRLYQAKDEAERLAATEQTVDRKIYEAQCALDLEKKNTKDQILQKYFNIAFFGENSYGIEAAANTYFGIPAAQLNVQQAAMIVGTVQSPSAYNPYEHPEAAKARRDLVISNMVKEGDLAAADGDAAKAVPIEQGLVARQPVKRGCAYADSTIVNVGFFCDYAYKWLTTPADQGGGGLAANTVDTSGWKIITTINPGLQNTIQASLTNDMDPASASAAVMPVIDPTNGAITAMATSRLYGDVPGNPGYTTDSLFTSAYAGTGSTYKYFTMLAALKAGAEQTLSLTAPSPYTPKKCTQNTAITPISNATERYSPTLTLRAAAIQSSNTYFVAVEDQVFGCDLSPIVNTALDLGVKSLRRLDGNGQSRGNNIIAGQEYGYTLGMEVTSAMELTSAYGAIANDGTYCPPIPVASVTDAAGNPVAFAKPACTPAFSPVVARTALNILVGDTKAGEGGTATGAFGGYYRDGGSPIAGKTGTNNDVSDKFNAALWFVGVTPHLVSATALVNPLTPTTPILDAPGFSGNASNAYGAVSAGVWSRALSGYLMGQPAWTWPTPDSVPGQVNVPLVLGKSPAEAISILQQAGFASFQNKTDCGNTAYPKGSVATSSPKRALPGSTVMICLSSGANPVPNATPTTPAVPGVPIPAATPTPGTTGTGGVVVPPTR